MSHCRSCHAPIRWAITIQGNYMPLDAEPDPAGNVLLTGRRVQGKDGYYEEVQVDSGPGLFDDGRQRFMPHHATCPQGAEWRRTS